MSGGAGTVSIFLNLSVELCCFPVSGAGGVALGQRLEAVAVPSAPSVGEGPAHALAAVVGEAAEGSLADAHLNGLLARARRYLRWLLLLAYALLAIGFLVPANRAELGTGSRAGTGGNLLQKMSASPFTVRFRLKHVV